MSSYYSTSPNIGKIEGGKYIAAVVSKIEQEVKTAYLTHGIKIGRIYEQD